MIDGGTFQVGLTVMYFISAVSHRRLFAGLADHDLGLPVQLAVVASG